MGVPFTVLTTSSSCVLFRNRGESSLSGGGVGTETSRADAASRAPGVDPSVAERGAVPALAGCAGTELKSLVTGQLDVGAGVRLHEHQLALLGEHQQVRVHQDQAAHAEVVRAPHQVAGAQLDAVEAGRQESAVVPDQRINVTLITHRAHPDAPVIGAGLVIQLCDGPRAVSQGDLCGCGPSAIRRGAEDDV